MQVQVMRQHKSVAGAAGEEGVADTAEVSASWHPYLHYLL